MRGRVRAHQLAGARVERPQPADRGDRDREERQVASRRSSTDASSPRRPITTTGAIAMIGTVWLRPPTARARARGAGSGRTGCRARVRAATPTANPTSAVAERVDGRVDQDQRQRLAGLGRDHAVRGHDVPQVRQVTGRWRSATRTAARARSRSGSRTRRRAAATGRRRATSPLPGDDDEQQHEDDPDRRAGCAVGRAPGRAERRCWRRRRARASSRRG